MKILDISVPVDVKLPVWPGDPQVKVVQAASTQDGDGYNLSRMEISAHSGTHIDAPYHFLADGGKVGSIPLEWLMGVVQVVEVPAEVNRINAEVIEKLQINPEVSRILFKTANSSLWSKNLPFYQAYTALDSSGAEKLAQMNLHLVGIDYLSISVFDDVISPHEILLSRQVVLLEGCDLSAVSPGMYQLICLPLRMDELEGAPVRAVLLQE